MPRGIGKTFLAIEIAYAVAQVVGVYLANGKHQNQKKYYLLMGRSINPEFMKIITPDVQEMCAADLSTLNGQKNN